MKIDRRTFSGLLGSIALLGGLARPAPAMRPLSYDKFVAQLRAAGIRTERRAQRG